MLEQMFLDVDEYVYGLASVSLQFVKNGQMVEMWNEDGGTASEIAYKNIPFYVTEQRVRYSGRERRGCRLLRLPAKK